MSEVETVDAVETPAAADAAANQDVNPSAEGSSPKASHTYTEEEHDAIVKARIDKQRAKFAVEMDEAKQKLEAANAELAAYKAKEAVENARKTAADEYGVPIAALDGETESEIRAQARALKAQADAQPAYQPFKDSGEHKEAPHAVKVPRIF